MTTPPPTIGKAYRKYATLLMLGGLPDRLSLDGETYNDLPESFQGFKGLLPRCAHLVQTWDNNKKQWNAFLIYIEPGKPAVLQYDAERSQYAVCSQTQALEAYRQGVMNLDFDAGLLPHHCLKDEAPSLAWYQMTRWCTARVIAGLHRPWLRHDADLVWSYFPEDVSWTELPPRKPDKAKRGSRTGRALSHIVMDRSEDFASLWDKKWMQQYSRVLGEVQMAYLMFTKVSRPDALEQYKELLSLLLNCDEAVERDDYLWIGLMDVITAQILDMPDHMFVNGSDEYFLKTLLRGFSELGNSRTTDDNPEWRRVWINLKNALQNHMGWFLDYEDDPDAPVVEDVDGILSGPGSATQSTSPYETT